MTDNIVLKIVGDSSVYKRTYKVMCGKVALKKWVLSVMTPNNGYKYRVHTSDFNYLYISMRAYIGSESRTNCFNIMNDFDRFEVLRSEVETGTFKDRVMHVVDISVSFNSSYSDIRLCSVYTPVPMTRNMVEYYCRKSLKSYNIV